MHHLLNILNYFRGKRGHKYPFPFQSRFKEAANPHHIPITKINSKWINSLNIWELKPYKSSKKTVMILHDLGFGSGFLDITAKAWGRKGKDSWIGRHQIRNFWHKCTLSRRWRGNLQNAREYLKIISDKDLIPNNKHAWNKTMQDKQPK